MRHRLLRFIIHFWRHEHGAVTVIFAIMLPLLILFYSVAFDGARMQSGRARLEDAINQGALAVAMTDNRNLSAEDKKQNIELLHNYISWYLPDATVSDQDLVISEKLQYHASSSEKLASIEYNASGVVNLRPIISGNRSTGSAATGVGFEESVKVNGGGNNGKVRRFIKGNAVSTDYALVLDFSGSMNRSSAEPGMTRIALLKKVVQKFSSDMLSNRTLANKISIVPFSIGVPVILPGSNPFGGNNFGCSYVGKFIAKYENLDMKFWYNKAENTNSRFPAFSYNADRTLFNWYKNVVGVATGQSLAEMVTKGWCVKNPQSVMGINGGRAEYSCDADRYARLSENEAKFRAEFPLVKELIDYHRQTYATFNRYTMDFAGLVEGDYMFSDRSIFTYNYVVNSDITRPFVEDCVSAFGRNVNITTAKSALTDRSVKPESYLIDLTDDISVIDQIQQMAAVWRAENINSLGMLRALPVLAKGKNPRKVIIVISDGIDTEYSGSSNNHYPDHIGLTEELFVKYDLCEKIKSGLKRYPAGTPTTEADIFFIFTVDNEEALASFEMWGDHCAGRNNIFLATNYQQLITTLNNITNRSSINYVNDKE